MYKVLRPFSKHKTLLISLGVIFLYSGTLAFATTLVSPGTTLDPLGIPGSYAVTPPLTYGGAVTSGHDGEVTYIDASGNLTSDMLFTRNSSNGDTQIGKEIDADNSMGLYIGDAGSPIGQVAAFQKENTLNNTQAFIGTFDGTFATFSDVIGLMIASDNDTGIYAASVVDPIGRAMLYSSNATSNLASFEANGASGFVQVKNIDIVGQYNSEINLGAGGNEIKWDADTTDTVLTTFEQSQDILGFGTISGSFNTYQDTASHLVSISGVGDLTNGGGYPATSILATSNTINSDASNISTTYDTGSNEYVANATARNGTIQSYIALSSIDSIFDYRDGSTGQEGMVNANPTSTYMNYKATGGGKVYQASISEGLFTFSDQTNSRDYFKIDVGSSLYQIGDISGADSGTIFSINDQTQAITFGYNGDDYTFPIGDGSSGQVLQTNGAGQLSWAIPTAGAAGSAGELQFNTGGALDTDSGLVWDNSTKKLTISQGLTFGNIPLLDSIVEGNSPGVSTISGNYEYVPNYSGTVSVIDISTPSMLTLAATVTVGTAPQKPIISGNYAYVTNNSDGTVSVIDISTPASANVVATVTVGAAPYKPAISGNYAYVSNETDNNVSVIDISTPASANVVATVSVGNTPRAGAISGNYLYVPNGNDGTISVVDISTPASANVVATVTVGNSPLQPTISGSYVYVSNANDSTISVIDISTPASANVVTTVALGVYAGGDTTFEPTVSGNYIYVTKSIMSGNGEMYIIDISTPASATVVGTVATEATPRQPTISGNYAYIVNSGSDTMSVIDVSTPSSPSIHALINIGTNSGGNTIYSPIIVGNNAYVTKSTMMGGGIVYVYDLSTVSYILPAADTVALTVEGTIQSQVLSGGGVIDLVADNEGNIVPSFSDQSLKENVLNITDALTKINHLQGKYFNWKDVQKFGSQREIGFIAQEVEPFVPEVVRTVGSLKTINYANLVALQNEAIKELDIKIQNISSLQSGGTSIVDQFIDLVLRVRGLIVGSPERRTGITLYDEVTGEPYCISVASGAPKTVSGECAEIVPTSSTPEDPPAEEPPAPSE